MAYILNVTDTDEATAATYTVSLGAHATGDLLLVCLSQDGGGTTIAQSGGSDWTFLGTQAASGGCRQAWAYKVATSGAETNPTFSGANDEWLATSLVIRDADPVNPFGASPASGTDYVRTDWDAVQTSNSGALTTAVDECLLIYSWCVDGAARYLRTPMSHTTADSKLLGANVSHVVLHRQQVAAGVAPTATMYCNVATEGGNGWVLAVRNKSGGILQPIVNYDVTEVCWYGPWGAPYGAAAVTLQAPDAFAASINGITCSSTLSTAANSSNTYARYLFGTSLTSTESTAGAWVGATHTIASTDMSGGIATIHWWPSGNSTAAYLGDQGVIVGFSDGTNWITYQLSSRAKRWTSGFAQCAMIDTATATPFAASGSINWAAVTRVGYFLHRVGSVATSYAFSIGNLLVFNGPTAITGGGPDRPLTYADYHNAIISWDSIYLSGVSGMYLYTAKLPVQIGDGVEYTYYDTTGVATEFPPSWSAVATQSWQMDYNVGSGASWISVLASPADEISIKNGLVSAAQSQYFLIDAASETAAVYSFAQPIVGFSVEWKTGVPCDSVVFARCLDIDLKGASANRCTWTGSQATTAAVSLSATGGSITESTFTRGAESYAVEISAAGDYVLEGNTYTGYTKEIYVSASSGTVTITILSSDAVPDYDTDGATVVIDQPYTSQANITNLEAGSRVYIYNVTTATEIYNGVVAGTSYSQGYNDGTDYTDGDVVEVRIAWSSGALAKLPVSYSTVASATGWAVLAQQTDDDVYNTNAIDGDTVTEFVADYPNVQIDIDDPDGVTTVQRGYAWYISGQMTGDGIRYYHGAMTAEDAYNYRINVDVADMRIQNIDTDPVQVLGGRLYRSDGTRVTESGSGPIEMEYGRAYIASSSGTCPTAYENATAVWADPRALTLQKFMALK